SVPYATASVTLVPTAADGEMSIRINGEEVTSGMGSTQALAVGANTINVTVTSASGTVTKTYALAITRGRAAQTIAFAPLAPRTLGDADFDPGASASSGLPVSYVSDNPAVATIVDGKIRIVDVG